MYPPRFLYWVGTYLNKQLIPFLKTCVSYRNFFVLPSHPTHLFLTIIDGWRISLPLDGSPIHNFSDKSKFFRQTACGPGPSNPLSTYHTVHSMYQVCLQYRTCLLEHLIYTLFALQLVRYSSPDAPTTPSA